MAEFFNLYLNESWSPEFWKVSSAVAIFKNIWEPSVTKNYRPISLLFVVNKLFEKLKNNMFVDHIEKIGIWQFSNLQYGSESSANSSLKGSQANWKSTGRWSLSCFKSLLKILYSNYLKFCSNLPVKLSIFVKSNLRVNSFYCLFDLQAQLYGSVT